MAPEREIPDIISKYTKYQAVAVGIIRFGSPDEPMIPAINTLVSKVLLESFPELTEERLEKAVKLGHWQEIEWEREEIEWRDSSLFSRTPQPPKYLGVVIEETKYPVVRQILDRDPE